MRIYRVTVTGTSPLLMHNDNIQWADFMKKWLLEPMNKQASEAGDDRTPAWKWIGALYHDAGRLVLPSDNTMTVIREGGAKCPTGRGQATFKRQTQSGVVVNEIAWPLLIGGKPVPVQPLLDLRAENDFEKHEQAARELGFELFVKRAKIGQAKHVRVRPRFNEWSASGTLTVFDDTITTSVLQNIWTFAGAYSGYGDWRPSSPKAPGSFGKFTAIVEEVV